MLPPYSGSGQVCSSQEIIGVAMAFLQGLYKKCTRPGESVFCHGIIQRVKEIVREEEEGESRSRRSQMANCNHL
jgi:hypothetical protein